MATGEILQSIVAEILFNAHFENLSNDVFSLTQNNDSTIVVHISTFISLLLCYIPHVNATVHQNGSGADRDAQKEELHKKMVGVSRMSRDHFAQMKEQEDELEILKQKMAAAEKDVAVARKAEANAVAIAVKQVEAKVSQVRAYQCCFRLVSAPSSTPNLLFCCISDCKEMIVAF